MHSSSLVVTGLFQLSVPSLLSFGNLSVLINWSSASVILSIAHRFFLLLLGIVFINLMSVRSVVTSPLQFLMLIVRVFNKSCKDLSVYFLKNPVWASCILLHDVLFSVSLVSVVIFIIPFLLLLLVYVDFLFLVS